MSDYDDELDTDIHDSNYGSISDLKKKSTGSAKKGLLVGLSLTIVLELILGFILTPQTNLVHRLIVYNLGLIILIVVAFITRSTFKMIFNTLIILAASFALPLFLPERFSGLMTPFLHLFPVSNYILGIAEAVNIALDPQVLSYAQYLRYAIFAIDIFFALIVGMLCSISISGLIKLFTKKSNIVIKLLRLGLSTFFFIFSFFILPYLLVVISGGTQFVLAMGAGTASLSAGFQESTNPAGNMTLANEYFIQASEWFLVADQMIQGLKDLQVTTLLGLSIPEFTYLITSGLTLISASVNLAQGIVPAMSGVSSIQNGIATSMGVLTSDSSNNTALTMNSLSSTDVALFNEGLAEMELGFSNFSQSIDFIQLALADVNSIDSAEFKNNMGSTGLSNGDEIDMIKEGAGLFDKVLGVLNILISDPDGNGPLRAPFIHLLLGAFSLNEVSELVGTESNYSGTGSYFNFVRDNMSYVEGSLDNTIDGPVKEFYDYVITVGDLSPVKADFAGTFDFIRDASNISASFASYGLLATPSLSSMNTSLSIFQEYDNITVIPRSNLNGNITSLDETIANASSMVDLGTSITALINNMNAQAETGSYGFMQGAAESFVSMFNEFDLQKDGTNFWHMAQGYQSILNSVIHLQDINTNVNHIQENIDQLGSGSFSTFPADIETNRANIESNTTSIEVSLVSVRYYLVQANGNFSLTIGMESVLSTTINALTNITQTGGRLDIIDIHIGNLSNLATNATTEVTSQLILNNYISDFTNQVNGITDQIALISTDLAGAELSS
ncbi:MAG: hypothetical protein OEZ01_03695, partial [Candidatus Heimdallarchaeota archaeon]|nr:hypothetical protein [Candidatus Heimdallarchaeota archaeon]MDH5645082.1 hypothetical protein [Candidatus Heimdallarchaeota archaeon]